MGKSLKYFAYIICEWHITPLTFIVACSPGIIISVPPDFGRSNRNVVFHVAAYNF